MTTSGGGWTLMYSEDFESGTADGWSYTETSNCGSWGRILGGYGHLSGTTVSRSIDIGGIAHDEVRVELSYISIDSWDDEYGYVMLESSTVWSERYHHSSGSTVCGQSSHRDRRAEISETVAHDGETLELDVSSNLDQSSLDESFGIDDVVLWVR